MARSYVSGEVFGVDGTFGRYFGEEEQFYFPKRVAVRGDQVIVGDSTGVRMFGVDGSFVRWLHVGECDLVRPLNKVYKTADWDTALVFERGCAVRGDELIVADYVNDSVKVFGADGSLVREWGTRGCGPGQLNGPCGVAVMGDEVIVCDFSNCRIQVFC